MRRSLAVARLSWVAALLSASLAAPLAVADSRKFDTPVGRITLDLDPQWSTLRDMPDGIGFEVGGGRTMQFALRSLTVEIPDGMTDSQARAIVAQIRRDFGAEGAKSGDVKGLSGTYVAGHYVKLTNPVREPVPGEHRHIYIGFVRTGARPILFVIGWSDGGDSHAARALQSVRSMKVQRR